MEYDRFIDKIAKDKGTSVEMVAYLDAQWNVVPKGQGDTIKVVYGNGDVAFYTRVKVYGASEVAHA